MLLYAGLLCYFLGIEFNRSTMIAFAFFVNLVLIGTDIWSYRDPSSELLSSFEQASQFEAGQTNYMEINSHTGPCFNPAGHLWHYMLFVKLFYYSNDAYYIFKGIHCVLQSLTFAMVGQLAYKYFNADRAKAQVIVFMLMAAHDLRVHYMELYIDRLVAFYVTAAVATLVAGSSELGAVLLSLGASIKMSTPLTVAPAFFGWIWRTYGSSAVISAVGLFGFV